MDDRAKDLADRLVDHHDSFLAKDCADMLRYLQAEIDGYHQQALKDAEAISKLVGEMFELEQTNKQLQSEIRDLQQQVAFLEDWRAVWAPQIKQLQGVTK